MKVEIIKHYAETHLKFKSDYVIDLIVDGEVIYKKLMNITMMQGQQLVDSWIVCII